MAQRFRNYLVACSIRYLHMIQSRRRFQRWTISLRLPRNLRLTSTTTRTRCRVIGVTIAFFIDSKLLHLPAKGLFSLPQDPSTQTFNFILGAFHWIPISSRSQATHTNLSGRRTTLISSSRSAFHGTPANCVTPKRIHLLTLVLSRRPVWIQNSWGYVSSAPNLTSSTKSISAFTAS